jgi:hypothetical protein
MKAAAECLIHVACLVSAHISLELWSLPYQWTIPLAGNAPFVWSLLSQACFSGVVFFYSKAIVAVFSMAKSIIGGIGQQPQLTFRMTLAWQAAQQLFNTFIWDDPWY